MGSFASQIAEELDLRSRGVLAVLELLEGGATVPFIARYRKEQTGSLDEVQIRAIENRQGQLLALEERRSTILASIEEQGKLSAELRKAIAEARSRAELEDLYLPYKRKRRTRATVARERGLEPLARKILGQPVSGDPRTDAARFIDPKRDVPDVESALSGARDIVAEVVSEHLEARRAARETFATHGVLRSKAARGKAKTKSKFEQYYDFSEPLRRIRSHRVLAVFRGEAEGFLKGHIEVDDARLVRRLLAILGQKRRSPFAQELEAAVTDSLKRLLGPSVENQVRADLELRAHREAIDVFGTNLEALLLAAPFGAEPVLGIDPGFRTGCKCAAVDGTGAFLGHRTVFPDRKGASGDLIGLIDRYRPKAVAVGNGTAGRETEAFVRKTLRAASRPEVIVVSVNESGASVYSASEIARDEHPDLDLTVRGAISIARRLQDPLSELVKIDPKAIGVGQYQHDVDQKLLAAQLSQVTESCVNRVGVELNTASAPLLAHVAGLGPSLAKRIVAYRRAHGRFLSRASLSHVKGLGPKAFEQCAGFLRVREGAHPLDGSAVHPERYALVEKIAADLGEDLATLVGSAGLAERIRPERYLGSEVGAETLRDIVNELQKPGRDPRKRFEAPKFREDVREITDLREGMRLEGVVTNVTNFGAFVDIGVHQDGLVHISQLADRFVSDPHEVVKVGDRLKVRVMTVDVGRNRIGLSAKSG
ncbi:MAG: Tex family protein [Myxococcota bacterium]